MTYAAIADQMKISRDSVKELLQRAAIRVCGSRQAKKSTKFSRNDPPCRQSGASL